MPDTKDPATRRFGKFHRAVVADVARSTAAWQPPLKTEYRAVMDALVDEYLAAITSLKRLMDPTTFLAGARFLVSRFLRGTGTDVPLLASERHADRARSITSAICRGRHEAARGFCKRCFALVDGSDGTDVVGAAQMMGGS